MRPRILLIAISLFSATYSAGENTVENDSHFINITTQSGLANNNVYGICGTKKTGWSVIATSQPVPISRLNAYSFPQYRSNASR